MGDPRALWGSRRGHFGGGRVPRAMGGAEGVIGPVRTPLFTGGGRYRVGGGCPDPVTGPIRSGGSQCPPGAGVGGGGVPIQGSVPVPPRGPGAGGVVTGACPGAG